MAPTRSLYHSTISSPITVTGYEPGRSTVAQLRSANAGSSNMANEKSIVLLEDGVSFIQWRAALQAKLARRNMLGHVFHDVPGIRPVMMPTDPTITTPNAINIDKLMENYVVNVEQRALREIEAKNIIISRLGKTNCPQSYEHVTSKQLYDNIASTRQETATTPYLAVLETLLQVKFETKADNHIDSFLAGLQSVNNAADAFNHTYGSNNVHKID